MEVCVRRVRCAGHQCGSGCEGWASGMKVREVVRLVRDVKRVRMEVSVAGAADDMEVRLVVLAILKCERVWVLTRVGSRARKRAVQAPKKLAKVVALTEGAQKGGTGSSCETGSGAGERNEAVGRVRAGVGAGASGTATRETRSGCGNWHNRRTGGSADKHHKAHLKHAIKHFM